MPRIVSLSLVEAMARGHDSVVATPKWLTHSRASSISRRERFGNPGLYFRVRKSDSECELSSDTRSAEGQPSERDAVGFIFWRTAFEDVVDVSGVALRKPLGAAEELSDASYGLGASVALLWLVHARAFATGRRTRLVRRDVAPTLEGDLLAAQAHCLRTSTRALLASAARTIGH